MKEFLRIAELGEVAEINPRLSGTFGESAEVSFLPMASLDAETGSINCHESRLFGEVRKGYTPFISGDLLIAKITPCFENGKIGQAQIPHMLGFGSTEFHVIRPNSKVAMPRFVFHFLRQKRVRLEGERKMTESAGQRRVPSRFFQTLRIPLPPLHEQKRIADILDKADELRRKRKEAISSSTP